MMGEIVLVLMGFMIAAVFGYIAWDAVHSSTRLTGKNTPQKKIDSANQGSL